MNQARKRTGTKKVLSMILVLVMLLSLLSMAAFTLPTAASSDSAASNDDFMRIFHLDCGRKYFSVSEIKGIIDQLAANHYTHLQLAFGNNGFRFLLNEMPVGSYTSDQVKNALTNGNNTYSNSKGADSSILSESDMDKIIEYATTKGISIIPMLNTPGHMDALVSAMSELKVGSKRSDSEMRLTDGAQVSFIEALQQKYIDYFAAKGSKYYNLAADEYSFSKLSDSEYTAFATYVNAIAQMVKDAGMTPMCYNDGINYSGKTTSVPFATDILVCYWAQDANYASVTELSNAGFKIINNNDAWYYVLDDYLNIWAKPQWRYEDALKGIRSTPVTQAKNVADKEVPVVGSVLCCWCDGPDRSYPANREKVYNLIKAMADANPDYFRATGTTPEKPGVQQPTENKTVSVTVGGTTTVTIDGKNLSADGQTYYTENSGIATVTVSGQNEQPGNVTYTNKRVSYSELAGSNTSWTRTEYYYKVGENYYPVYAYREYYSYYGSYYYCGYSTTDSTSDVNRIGVSRYDSNTVTVYSKSGQETIPASTTLTFKGVAVGTTYVTVGTVRYTIIVNRADLTSATTLPIQLWITNAPIEVTGVTTKGSGQFNDYNNGGYAQYVTVKADAANNCEEGVPLSDIVPVAIKDNATTTKDDRNATNVLWKGTVLNTTTYDHWTSKSLVEGYDDG